MLDLLLVFFIFDRVTIVPKAAGYALCCTILTTRKKLKFKNLQNFQEFQMGVNQ